VQLVSFFWVFQTSKTSVIAHIEADLMQFARRIVSGNRVLGKLVVPSINRGEIGQIRGHVNVLVYIYWF
jgi:hypothetical protein